MEEENNEVGDVNQAQEQENKSSISADLIRGHINTIILRSLYERDKYGYEIIDEIEKKSHGQYTLKQPTLYSALKRLENQGYISAYWLTDEVSLGGRRKYYSLTDSGREVAEKNQVEWEYSRTVIDSLISDKSFDFSMPAPTAVDFNILKQSTTRVRTSKSDDDDEEELDEENKNEEPVKEVIDSEEILALKEELIAVKEELIAAKAKNEEAAAKTEENTPHEDALNPQQIEVSQEALSFYEEPVTYENPTPIESVPLEKADEAIIRNSDSFAEPIADIEDMSSHYKALERDLYLNAESDDEPYNNEASEPAPMTETQKRILHENYIKLISNKPPEVKEDISPQAENIDTEKLIYNTRPETERDYRYLINNLFDKTLKAKAPQEACGEQTVTPIVTVANEEISSKAESDGLKVNSQEFVISNKKVYSRGAALFKSSIIICILMLFEFAMCLTFRNGLGVSLSYPFVIFSLAIAQLLIFAVLYYTYFERTSRKSASGIILSSCIIITVIIVLLIFVISLLLKVNFGNFSDVCAKIVIPCVIALNIPLFAVLFHVFE